MLERINIRGTLTQNEDLSAHTSFRTGGPADFFYQPADEEDLGTVIRSCIQEKIPYFLLGGGANILVSDKGVRGLVISTRSLDRLQQEGNTLDVGAGFPVSGVSAFAADQGLGGFEFIYSMPGSFGGAVWMNARCYGSELADLLKEVRYLDLEGKPARMIPKREEFRYKDTPFMRASYTILSAKIELEPGKDSLLLWEKMRSFEMDRRSKGHFLAPCAGSVFKNNRDFGAPSGQIIDSLGLRGTRIGGAQLSPLHANIIINENHASSQDIRSLMLMIQEKVQASYGYRLEPEVILVGDWE